jgi:hypothetical protein
MVKLNTLSGIRHKEVELNLFDMLSSGGNKPDELMELEEEQ